MAKDNQKQNINEPNNLENNKQTPKNNMENAIELGEIFKNARYSKKLSFNTIKDLSFVNPMYFEKIENANYDNFSDIFYLKLYMKEYIKILGLEKFKGIYDLVDRAVEEVKIQKDNTIYEETIAINNKIEQQKKQNIEIVSKNKNINRRQKISDKKTKIDWVKILILLLALFILFSAGKFAFDTVNSINKIGSLKEQEQIKKNVEKTETKKQEEQKNKIKVTKSFSDGKDYISFKIEDVKSDLELKIKASDKINYSYCDSFSCAVSNTWTKDGSIFKSDEEKFDVSKLNNFAIWIDNPEKSELTLNNKKINLEGIKYVKFTKQ